ncbi:MAG: hypothetical protein Q8O88_00080 [bacterium]|nr:hypothetical protein [bacterium]
MTKSKFAVLIEAMSIQQYVFSSNKLRENIGASYIVEKLLYGKNGLMDKILKEMYGHNFDIELWKNSVIHENLDCEIGYVGGGNTLVFFSDELNAIAFIKRFSRDCILNFPSLRITFGVKGGFNNSDYKNEFQKLLQNLKERKAQSIPIVSIPKHGITADCPWSNDTAEVFEDIIKKYISHASKSKIQAAKEAQNNQEKTFKSLNGKYCLTDEIDFLGQNKESSYIAVVHIDGNGMGKIFSRINGISDLRMKSKAVSLKAHNAMEMLIGHIIFIKENKLLDGLNFKSDGNNRTILPIRPILVGGDDVTFICEGRLGLYLAEKFIEIFYDKTERDNKNNIQEKLMDGACAGVAIVKSHFPFYKAVKLAEELCSEAKKISRSDGGSSISYYYSATTFSGSLDELRKKTHEAQSGNMYYGPYKLFDENDTHSIENLKNGIKHFNIGWPKNKVMQLREIIADSGSAQKLFEKEISEIGLELPNSQTSIWANSHTAFFDQIELMDFYIDTLL